MQCNICERIFHFVRDYPDYVSGFPKKENEINCNVIQKSEETANIAILDSGCTKTVSGEKWLTWYLELLPEDDKKQVTERKSDDVVAE